jgi:hypothetical protein
MFGFCTIRRAVEQRITYGIIKTDFAPHNTVKSSNPNEPPYQVSTIKIIIVFVKKEILRTYSFFFFFSFDVFKKNSNYVQPYGSFGKKPGVFFRKK